MSRRCPGFALFCLIFLPTAAQADDGAAETVIRLTVQPMPAPRPALRYLLLPDLKEQNPGNPIPNYLRCLVEQNEVMGRAALREADRAARLDKPDWQILQKAKSDGIGLLLPDVQKLRTLATGLQGRFQSEVALRHFDDALFTARTLFAMARHMAEHPTLIGDLVGMAITAGSITPLEEMVQQPGCPNLYWALTNLPTPFIALDKGLEGERLLIESEFHELDYHSPMSPAQINKLVVHIDKVLELDNKPRTRNGTREWLNGRTKDRSQVAAARQRLIDGGLHEEEVKRFPADQVVILDEMRKFEIHRDELMKLMALPEWQTEALAARIMPAKEPSRFDLFLPALLKVRRAQGRLDQRLALLRHVEALRLYAADHEGALPQKLSDVTVPLPDDPFTGKPFKYERLGATAHLRGSPPPSEEKNAIFNIHYEITIQK